MKLKRFLPAVILVSLLICAYFLGFFKFLDFRFLKNNFHSIEKFVAANKIISAIIFVGIYTFACAIGTPSLMVLSLGSGIFFGGILGGLLSGLGATFGSTILFLASQQAIGLNPKTENSKLMAKVKIALAKHEFLNLFAFRLIPIAPLFLISIAAAGLKVKLKNFILATFFGLWCVETSFAFVGASIENKLKSGQLIDWHALITPSFILPFIAMAALALLSNFLVSRHAP